MKRHLCMRLWGFFIRARSGLGYIRFGLFSGDFILLEDHLFLWGLEPVDWIDFFSLFGDFVFSSGLYIPYLPQSRKGRLSTFIINFFAGKDWGATSLLLNFHYLIISFGFMLCLPVTNKCTLTYFTLYLQHSFVFWILLCLQLCFFILYLLV